MDNSNQRVEIQAANDLKNGEEEGVGRSGESTNGERAPRESKGIRRNNGPPDNRRTLKTKYYK